MADTPTDNAFTDIRKTMFGDSNPKMKAMDEKIDKILNKLSNHIVNKNAFNYAETIKGLLTQNLDSTSFDESVVNNIMQSPESLSRFARYSNAEEIITNIPQCSRALKVLVDGIVSPDNITKETIDFLIHGNENERSREIVDNLRSLNDSIEFESHISDIICQTLKYGDCFVELCDYKSKEVPITQSLYLAENAEEEFNASKLPKRFVQKKINITKDYLDENGYPDTTTKTITINLELYEDLPNVEIRSLMEAGGRTEKAIRLADPKTVKKERDRSIEVSDLRILMHEPTQIIKLQSDKYRMSMGFLVLPRNAAKDGNPFTGPPSKQSNNWAGSSSKLGALMGGFDAAQGIDALYKEILKLVSKYINTKDITVDKKELKHLLNRVLQDMDENNEKNLKVRYVPPERMEHFNINHISNFPYGEGIFEKTMYAAKLYIALKNAITIKRMGDASEKRIIYVDTTMPRNSRNMIETLKDKLKKRKYSVDTFSNISTISTMITSYEDYIIPQNKGRRYVEFETLPPSGNIRDASEELKLFRDDIVSSLEVPPAFINLEENIGNKSVLSHESSLFAETILSYQKVFSNQLFSFFSKLYKYAYQEKISPNIKIILPPPKMLRIEKEGEHAEIVARLIQAYSESGDIPKSYLVKKYLPVNWDEVADFKIKESLDNRSKPTKPDPNADMDPGMGGAPGAQQPF